MRLKKGNKLKDLARHQSALSVQNAIVRSADWPWLVMRTFVAWSELTGLTTRSLLTINCGEQLMPWLVFFGPFAKNVRRSRQLDPTQ